MRELEKQYILNWIQDASDRAIHIAYVFIKKLKS